MGSKRKLAPKILDFILERHPKCEYFYDLFGGGGAVSFEALQRPQIKKVFYNELNTGVCNLLKKIRDDGVTSEFYEWVSRDKFHELKSGDDWKSGLIKTCWSFGNCQRTYMFGESAEKQKRLLHEFVVNKCEDSIREFEETYGLVIPRHLNNFDTINERRLSIMGYIKKSILGRVDLQQLEQLERLQQLQQLQQIEQLERLQQLEQLQQLEISNMSYEDVVIENIPENTVIYLDPPYIGTMKYQKDILHDDLYDYINDSKYPIYMSSYKSDLDEVLSMNHISTLNNNNVVVVVEKLFANKIALNSAILKQQTTGILDF